MYWTKPTNLVYNKTIKARRQRNDTSFESADQRQPENGANVFLIFPIKTLT